MVSGIVVNFRTPELTIRAAESLLDDGVDEVVVVENGSGDGSADLLTAWADRDGRARVVVSGENLGFGSGVNLGATRARGDLLFLLNSDAQVRAGATEALTAALHANPGLAAVAPCVINQRGDAQVDAHGTFPSLRTLMLRTNRRPPDIDEPDWISGVAMLIHHHDFDEVHGFDPRYFMYFEDIDLCRRLRERSRRVGRVRIAIVEHDHRASQVSEQRFLEHYYAAQDLYVGAAGWARWRRRTLSWARLPIQLLRRLRADRRRI